MTPSAEMPPAFVASRLDAGDAAENAPARRLASEPVPLAGLQQALVRDLPLAVKEVEIARLAWRHCIQIARRGLCEGVAAEPFADKRRRAQRRARIQDIASVRIHHQRLFPVAAKCGDRRSMRVYTCHRMS